MRNKNIVIRYFDDNLPILKGLEQGDWVDLYIRQDIGGITGSSGLVGLNVAMKLPDGYEAHVVPRSSTFSKYGIIQTNGIGIIDNSYSGNDDEWMFPFYMTKGVHVPRGTRICQFRIVRKQPELSFQRVKKLKDSNRGGFGSTGER